MTYLNHAATSYPKPPSVIEAMVRVLQAPPVSALRSTAGDDDDLPRQLRQALAAVLQTKHPESIVITSGATDSINRLVVGLGIPDAIATADNHNSVLRPLYNQPAIAHVEIVEDVSVIDTPARWPSQWRGRRLVVVPHCSNVTGHIHDIPSICAEAHKRGMTVLVDAAQSAGCIPIDADGWGADLIAFTGHKGLFGPQGTGGFFFRPNTPLRPTLFGGTGRDSSIVDYAGKEWEHEVGTPNTPGMAGLKAGVDFVLSTSVESIYRQVQEKTQRLIQQLDRLDKVTVYHAGSPRQGPVVSFNIEGLLPSDVGYLLENAYGITVRTGLHCAPLMHQTLGTAPHGTVRASLSHLTTDADLDALVDALHEIVQGL